MVKTILDYLLTYGKIPWNTGQIIVYNSIVCNRWASNYNHLTIWEDHPTLIKFRQFSPFHLPFTNRFPADLKAETNISS